jgi:hypothetical protein
MRIAQETDAQAIGAAEVASVRRALEVVTTAVDGLGRFYALGKIAEEDYVRQYAEVCQDREAARARIAEAAGRRASLDRAGQRWADLMDFFRDLQAKLAAEAPDEQGQIGAPRSSRAWGSGWRFTPTGASTSWGAYPASRGPSPSV